MWLLAAVALAAPPEAAPAKPELSSLTVDAKVPVELLLGGVTLGELQYPAVVTFQVPAGTHVLRVFVSGTATDVPVTVATGAEARVLVGRNGISTSAPEKVVATGPQRVEFRLSGPARATVKLDGKAHGLQSSEAFVADLAPGRHTVSVRSADGTAIWATGELSVDGGPLVVLVTEGRLPEVSGDGAFHPAGG